MEKDIRKYLFDILESIKIIEQYWTNINDYTSFSNNLLVQDAVQRRLSIIGEATWKASKISPSLNITNFKKIVSFRHILIHDYDKIEPAAIWLIITKNLQLLKEETEFILNEHNGSSIN